MPFKSTKRYTHELGLSAVFRQWRANSHCNLLHGYALSFKFTFACTTRDECLWVQDFGNLDRLKSRLVMTFDHRLVIAEDDPQKDELCALAGLGLASCIVLPGVGCEEFAHYAFKLAERTLHELNQGDRVWIHSVECCEHGANSAIYETETVV